MRSFQLSFVFALAFALSLAPPAGARPPARLPLDGIWRGPLQLPGGQVEVIYRLVKLSSGDYFAALDVPLQKVSNLSVTVAVRSDTVLLSSSEANSHYEGYLSADGQQLLGSWQQPGFQVPLTLNRTALPTARARLSVPYREEDVLFSNLTAGLLLGGTLTVPPGKGPFPAAVLLSDSGPHDRNGTVGMFAPLAQLADYLTRHGVVVLRFDSRGVGQSTGANQVTIAELVSDAQAALNLLRARPEVDFSRLGLIGHGEGANVALLAATQPLPPAFVVALAPDGLPGAEIALQQQITTLRSLRIAPEQIATATKRQQAMFELIRQTPDNVQAQAIVANMMQQNNASIGNAAAQASAAELVSPRYRYFLGFDPVNKLSQVACPTLVVYGLADQTLNVELNAAALLKGSKGNKSFQVKKLPGINHLFQPDPSSWPVLNGEPHPTFAPLAQESIRTWFLEQHLLN